MYELIYRKFGPYNPTIYHKTAGVAPKSWTPADYKKAYQEIYDELIADEVFQQHNMQTAKSADALINQVAWATTTQPLEKGLSLIGPSQEEDVATEGTEALNTMLGQRKTQRANRLAAYEAGWMTMRDICYLEEIEAWRSRLNEE